MRAPGTVNAGGRVSGATFFAGTIAFGLAAGFGVTWPWPSASAFGTTTGAFGFTIGACGNAIRVPV